MPAPAPLHHILVCGSGLAAQMTVAALSAQCPPHMQVTWLKIAGTEAKDVLYGSVTPPTAYDANLAIGVDEPSLVLDSTTAFSFGTQYVNWGPDCRNWVQAFHAPFPVVDGVFFYHYLLQRGIDDIAPYLVSAVVGKAGVFAHPPEDPRHPLSKAEYGYQFDPVSYGALFERQVSPRVASLTGAIARIDRDGDTITSVHLADGRTLTADLYIDCTGPDARLCPSGGFEGGRRLSFLAGREPSAELGPPLRTVTAGSFGWSARIPIEDANLQLTVYARADEGLALQAHGQAASNSGDFTLGRRAEPWSGNVVAIGLAAAVAEPVTPAPMLLLQRDIERLLSLLPVSPAMAVERREFNRQFAEDYRHAELFNRALFVSKGPPQGAYWEAAAGSPLDERLTGKLQQFESRGLHVAYDHEPFELEDWIIMHFGMGRRPERHDRIADHVAPGKVDQYFMALRDTIARAVSGMPPHAAYRQGLANFLKQRGSRVS